MRNNYLNTVSGAQVTQKTRNDRIKSASTHTPTQANVRRRLNTANIKQDDSAPLTEKSNKTLGLKTEQTSTGFKGRQKDSLGITLNNLQEGEVFDNEIERIISIVSNVEKQFGGKSVNKDFMNALHIATQQRQLKQEQEQVT